MANIGTRVKESAAMLDKKHPGWAGHIDTDRLDIGDTSNCVLGQLYGDYNRGRVHLCIEGVPNEELTGFFPESSNEEPGLNAAWRRRIKERQKHPGRFAVAA